MISLEVTDHNNILEKIKMLKDLQQSEADLHWKRNGFFLLSSSILLVALGQFHTSLIGLFFGILGLMLNILWLLIQYRSSEYIREWKAKVKKLEESLESSLDLYTPKAGGIEMRILAMLLPVPFLIIWGFIFAESVYGVIYHVDKIFEMLPSLNNTST